MRRYLLSGISALTLFCGCSENGSNDVSSVAEEIHTRPIVALIPVIDSSKSDLPWNLSKELTDLIFRRCSLRDKFYLVSPPKVISEVKRLDSTKDPFSTDLTWVKRAFSSSEFVVFVELIEHEESHRVPERLPVSTANLEESSADLNITIRIRALDIRGAEPKVVLQELLHESHHIPRQFTRTNFFQVSWDDESFAISPVGIAHNEIVKNIVGRLEEYLLRAKVH